MDNKKQKTENNFNAKQVAKSTVAMAVATFSSRITGLLRTWMMAFALGNTVITSAYQVANNMPNVIFDLVAGGLLGAAFIPIFMLEKEKHGDEGANYFSCNILNLTIIILGSLSLIATIFAPAVIATQTFTVGQDSYITETSVLFFRMFAFQILFYGISGVLTALLNGKRVFFMPAFAPAINNIVVIASFGAYYFISPTDQNSAIIILGLGTTLGVVIQCIMQIPSLTRCGFKWKPVLSIKDPALIAAIKIAIPTFIYIVGTLIAFTCRNAFSLEISENGPSTILYAWTWYQLPYGVIAVSLSRTMFTEMSEASAANNMPKLRKEIHNGLSTSLLLIIPLAILMIFYSSEIMSLFRAGSFNADDVGSVARILQLWVISLPLYCVVMYLYNVYASIKKFGIFAFVSCMAVILQCLMYMVFCKEEVFGLSGIPVADFLYYTICAIILLIILSKKVGNFGAGRIVINSIKVIIASIIGAGIGYYVSGFISSGQINMINGFIQLLVGGSISLIIIFMLCWLFRVEEINKIVNIIKRKFKR